MTPADRRRAREWARWKEERTHEDFDNMPEYADDSLIRRALLDAEKDLEKSMRLIRNIRNALEPGISPDSFWNGEWRKRIDEYLADTSETGGAE